MKLIDTHSHIYADDFKSEIENIISRSKECGIDKILLPNIDSKSTPQLHNLVDNYPETCIPMMGLHPTSVKENYMEELQLCERWLSKRKYIAIGEIGIDLYWDKTFLKQQQDAFEIQINWARELDLPIIIHSRESFNEIFEILDNHPIKKYKGVFHSFTGNQEQAKHAIDLGFYLGVNGIVTFKNAGLDKTISKIPIQNIVIETDSPYLAPAPHRGKRNESSFLIHIAQKLSEIYNISIEDIAKATSHNAKTLFNF